MNEVEMETDWLAVAAEYRLIIEAEAGGRNDWAELRAHLDTIRDDYTRPHLCLHDGIEDASGCEHAP